MSRAAYTFGDDRLLAAFLATYPKDQRQRPSTFKAFLVQHPNTGRTFQSWHSRYVKTAKAQIDKIADKIRRTLPVVTGGSTRDENDAETSEDQLDSDEPSQTSASAPTVPSSNPADNPLEPGNDSDSDFEPPQPASARSSARKVTGPSSAAKAAVASTSDTPSRRPNASNGASTSKSAQQSAKKGKTRAPPSSDTESSDGSMRDSSDEEPKRATAQPAKRWRKNAFTGQDFDALVRMRVKSKLTMGKSYAHLAKKASFVVSLKDLSRVWLIAIGLMLAQVLNEKGQPAHTLESWKSFDRKYRDHINAAVILYPGKNSPGLADYRAEHNLFILAEPESPVKEPPTSATKSALKGKGKLFRRESSSDASESEDESPPPLPSKTSVPRPPTSAVPSPAPQAGPSGLRRFTAEDDEKLATYRATAEFESGDLKQVWHDLEAFDQSEGRHTAAEWEARFKANRSAIAKVVSRKLDELEAQAGADTVQDLVQDTFDELRDARERHELERAATTDRADQADDEEENEDEDEGVVDEVSESEDEDEDENAMVATQLMNPPPTQPPPAQPPAAEAPVDLPMVDLVTSDDSDSAEEVQPLLSDSQPNGTHDESQPEPQEPFSIGSHSLGLPLDQSPPTPPRSSDDKQNSPVMEVRDWSPEENPFEGYPEYDWPARTEAEEAMMDELGNTILQLTAQYEEHRRATELEVEVLESQEDGAEDDEDDEDDDQPPGQAEDEVAEEEPASVEEDPPIHRSPTPPPPPPPEQKRPRDESTDSPASNKRARVESAVERQPLSAKELKKAFKDIAHKHGVMFSQVRSLCHCLSATGNLDTIDAACAWFSDSSHKPEPDTKAHLDSQFLVQKECWSPEEDKLAFEATAEEKKAIERRKGRRCLAARRNYLEQRGIRSPDGILTGWPWVE